MNTKQSSEEEIIALKEQIKVLMVEKDKTCKTISDIHNVKEPGQFVSDEDTLCMVKDMFAELKEEGAKSEALQKELDSSKKLKEEAMGVVSSYSSNNNICNDELVMALDRAGRSEKELEKLITALSHHGQMMHPIYGPCDTLNNNMCSACLATKQVADTAEQYMQELSLLRKMMRRSEVIMRKVSWNRKMQNPEEIKKTEEDAGTLAEEMHKKNP